MDGNATRSKKYAEMPSSKKMQLLQRRKENRAAKKKNAHLLPRVRKVPLGYIESGVSSLIRIMKNLMVRITLLCIVKC